MKAKCVCVCLRVYIRIYVCMYIYRYVSTYVHMCQRWHKVSKICLYTNVTFNREEWEKVLNSLLSTASKSLSDASTNE